MGDGKPGDEEVKKREVEIRVYESGCGKWDWELGLGTRCGQRAETRQKGANSQEVVLEKRSIGTMNLGKIAFTQCHSRTHDPYTNPFRFLCTAPVPYI